MKNINYKQEGFWNNSKNDYSEYPMPKPNEFLVDYNEILEQLSKIELKSQVHYCKGWSNCRICGSMNGTTEFEYKGWRWPEGLKHYIENHNVDPSKEFKEEILGLFDIPAIVDDDLDFFHKQLWRGLRLLPDYPKSKDEK